MAQIHMNVFRFLADISHILSKFILIWAIHSNKSAEGVSLITQALYVAVFCTRYLDLFWVPPTGNPWWWWNFVIKNFYIWSSIYIIILMMRVYARTREREKAWKMGAYSLIGSLVAAPLVGLIFEGPRLLKEKGVFAEILWCFSQILESVCILPQLLLLRQTTVPTVIDSFYLVTLGSYRALYILNWIVRYAGNGRNPEIVSVIFGIVQTALYVDFAWVYWTRQRVKLRGGGIVDSQDLSKGWLISKVMGRQTRELDEEEEPVLGRRDDAQRQQRSPDAGARSWGPRGISVSADEVVHEITQDQAESAGDEALADPSQFEDDDEDDLKDPPGEHTSGNGTVSGVSNGAEWRDDTNR